MSAVTICGFALAGYKRPVHTICFIFFTALVCRTPNALNDDRGRGRRIGEGFDGGRVEGGTGRGGDGSLAAGRNSTPIVQELSFTRNNQSERESRTSFENWVINEIKDFILNATGRHSQPPKHPQEVLGISSHDGFRKPSGTTNIYERTAERIGTLPPREKDQRPPGKRHQVEEVKFSPDQVSTHRNDIFIQFTLHNYTAKRVDGAELMLLLRYNHAANQQPVIRHRRPEVGRIAIEVYKDSGNATHDGNSSSPEKAPTTSSVFRIRRSRWVKVLLVRGWIKEALGSPDKVLRLHLVYDRSGAVDVVMTNDQTSTKPKRERPRLESEKPRRKLREGSVSRDGTDQRIAKRTLGKPRNPSPILVIRQRSRST